MLIPSLFPIIPQNYKIIPNRRKKSPLLLSERGKSLTFAHTKNNTFHSYSSLLTLRQK